MNNLIIIWTQEKKDKCVDLIEKWLQKYDAQSGEMIMQNDDCQIYASVLISDLVDDVIKPQYKDNY